MNKFQKYIPVAGLTLNSKHVSVRTIVDHKPLSFMPIVDCSQAIRQSPMNFNAQTAMLEKTCTTSDALANLKKLSIEIKFSKEVKIPEDSISADFYSMKTKDLPPLPREKVIGRNGEQTDIVEAKEKLALLEFETNRSKNYSVTEGKIKSSPSASNPKNGKSLSFLDLENYVETLQKKKPKQ